MVYDYNQTALHLAANDGHSDVMKELLDCKAGVNARDNFGKTPLHIASLHGHPNAVIICLNYGTDVNLKDLSGKTAFEYTGALRH